MPATNPLGTDTLSAGGHSQLHRDSEDHVTNTLVHGVIIPVAFSKQGVVAVSTDSTAGRWYNDTGRTLTFAWVRLSATTAPTGATLIVDINKDGTTIFTTQGNRPAIAISGTTIKVTNPDVTTIADGSYLTMNVDQVGSSVAGSDLVVTVGMTG